MLRLKASTSNDSLGDHLNDAQSASTMPTLSESLHLSLLDVSMASRQPNMCGDVAFGIILINDKHIHLSHGSRPLSLLPPFCFSGCFRCVIYEFDVARVSR